MDATEATGATAWPPRTTGECPAHEVDGSQAGYGRAFTTTKGGN